jgi:pyrroloquinoline quinone biosynthesis protein B
LIEASRTLSRQLFLWTNALHNEDRNDRMKIVGPISSLSITHLHLGHIDGIGQFGREVMGSPAKSIKLIASSTVIEDLRQKSYLNPFVTEEITSGSKVTLGKGVSLEFTRVPHRDEEGGDMHAIIIHGETRRILFLPDHDTYQQTLEFHKMSSLREWFQKLSVDVILLDGTFFSFDEVAGTRSDYTGIPHPPIEQSLEILGSRQEADPEIVFIHINHTNPLIDDAEKQKRVQELGWMVGYQGQTWDV